MLCLMERHALALEELGVTKSIGLSFHRLDFPVGPLEWSGGDGIFIPRQEARLVGAKCVRELLEQANSRGFSTVHPSQ